YPGTGKVITTQLASGGTCNGGSCTAARVVSVRDIAGGVNFVQNAEYAAFGGLTDMTQGSVPITTANTYNNRLQPTTQLMTIPTATILNLPYDFHLGAGDNGNVYRIVNGINANRSHNFLYDSLNRIQQAYSTGSSGSPAFNWGETFSPTATAPGVA